MEGEFASEGGKERRESLCEREGERERGRGGGRIVEGVCSKCHDIFNS